MIIGKKTIGNTGYAIPDSKPKLDPRQIMDIRVTRNASKDGATIGRMTVDGGWICYTLEDTVREPLTEASIVGSWKIPGQTAIPYGTYQVTLAHSQHFGRIMPHLLNVPGYEGVLIHSGNTAADTEGCILVGFTTGNNTVGNSRAAFGELFSQIEEAIKAGQKVWCTVV